MRNKLVGLSFFLLLFVDCSRPERSTGKEAAITDLVVQRLQLLHYNPARLNDEFSRKVFKLYTERLDVDKRFLLENDIVTLKKYEAAIDDQIEYGQVDFLRKANALLVERVKEARKISDKVLAKKLDFNKKLVFELDGEKRKYCKTPAELELRWQKIIKYQVLLQYVNKLKSKQTEKKLNSLSAARPYVPFNKTVREIKKKVKRNLDRYFKRQTENRVENIIALYANAIANVYDPHTTYLPPRSKEDFDISISGRLEGIGALLREDDGYIKVVRIVPGSASWRQKQLKAEDTILKVAQGSKEPVDIVGARISDAVRLIRGKKGTEVRLTVKRPDGEILVIPIIRDVVVVEETYAKSAIIHHKGLNKKFGYIFLPKFYKDFQRKNGRSASVDIKKELLKLKSNGVNSIILDLRNNGGGALDDAVSMSGLFIENGPIVQIKRRVGDSVVLNDPDSDIVYDGHLVVMINKFSASASEILAGAMQDYDRAIIVGSKSSFGKGTVQNIINLDRYASAKTLRYSPLGALKYTIQKFYRVNGASTQYKGVTPDIILPDTLAHLEVGEKDLDYSMKFDSVSPLKYRRWSKKYNKAQLKANSEARRVKSQRFALIRKNIERFKKRKDETRQELRVNRFLAEQDEIQAENKKFKSLETEMAAVQVQRVKVDGALPKISKDRLKSIEDWHKTIRKDTYIEEALQILNDMQN